MRASQRRIVDESFRPDSVTAMPGQRLGRPGAPVAAGPAAFESLEGRMLLSGTAVDAFDTTIAPTDSTVDAAAATAVNTNNGGGNDGGGLYVNANGKYHFHGKFNWV